MGTGAVVDFLPVAEFAIALVHFQRARIELIEFLGVGTVSAFHGAVEFVGAAAARISAVPAAGRPARTRRQTRNRHRPAERGRERAIPACRHRPRSAPESLAGSPPAEGQHHQQARSPLAEGVLLFHLLDSRLQGYELQPFFLITDCSASLSKLRSDTSFRKREFSSRSCLASHPSRRTSPSTRRAYASTLPLLAPRLPPSAPPPTCFSDPLCFRVPAPRYRPFLFRKNHTQLCSERGDQVKVSSMTKLHNQS
jgi:hypothetical protein